MSGLTGPRVASLKPTRRCAATGRPLADGETCVATLVERDGTEGLERIDFSLNSWQSGARPAPPARVIAAWRAVLVPPSARTRQLLSDEELLALFEDLDGAEDPRRLVFRHVLALLLLRKRLLKHEGADAGAMIVSPRAAPGRKYTVRDPAMDAESLQAAIEQFGAVLEGGAPESAEA